MGRGHILIGICIALEVKLQKKTSQNLSTLNSKNRKIGFPASLKSALLTRLQNHDLSYSISAYIMNHASTELQLGHLGCPHPESFIT